MRQHKYNSGSFLTSPIPVKVIIAVAALVAVWTGARARAREVRERPVVEVAEGTVRGLITTRYNVTYLEFLGIPFATPPLGPLRFKDPEPAATWEGELDASQMPRPCNQFIVRGSEDCLYLNVFTPEDSLITDYPRPVMVYIHGGGNYFGGAYQDSSFENIISKGIIVVQVQYRLGVLGFLSTEDSAAPGNQGLKDQTLALQWLNRNAAAFGGDPSRITIFGGSSGAASVHYQMLAPSAAGTRLTTRRFS